MDWIVARIPESAAYSLSSLFDQVIGFVTLSTGHVPCIHRRTRICSIHSFKLEALVAL